MAYDDITEFVLSEFAERAGAGVEDFSVHFATDGRLSQDLFWRASGAMAEADKARLQKPERRVEVYAAIDRYRATDKGKETQRAANRKYAAAARAAKKAGLSLADYRAKAA
jgi:hypothetical protein